MRGLRHVREIFAQLRIEPTANAVAIGMRFGECLERSMIERTFVLIEEIAASQRSGNEKRRNATLSFSGAGEFDAEAPRLHLPPIGPREFEGDITHRRVAHVLRNTGFFL